MTTFLLIAIALLVAVAVFFNKRKDPEAVRIVINGKPYTLKQGEVSSENRSEDWYDSLVLVGRKVYFETAKLYTLVKRDWPYEDRDVYTDEFRWLYLSVDISLIGENGEVAESDWQEDPQVKIWFTKWWERKCATTSQINTEEIPF